MIAQLVATLAILVGAAYGAINVGTSCDLGMHRLPKTFLPLHYQLTIDADLNRMEFHGIVDIQLKRNPDQLTAISTSKKSRKLPKTLKRVLTNAPLEDWTDCSIILNVGRSIVIDSIELIDAIRPKDGRQIRAKKACLDARNQLLAIKLTRKFQMGQKGRLRIAYHDRIGKETTGFYQSPHSIGASTYVNANSHFFPADARSAFPCFDEPDFKASFNLTLVHATNLVSFSNTIALTSQQIDGKKVVIFKPTPKMSTYVFGFAIGQYDSISCRVDEPTVTAYTPVGRSSDAKFVLDTACRAIELAEEYFDLSFPMEKLDLVVTSHMKGQSAREIWGMILVAQDFMLTDSDTTNLVRTEIAKVTVKEVLHHWFGNLVTTKWWNDQWIFDGFTIWQSHWMTAKLYPEFDLELDYLLRLQSPLLDAQSSADVRAIETHEDLDADSQIALLDANTHNKAAALYRMLSTYVGEEKFRDALVKFVKDHQFATAGADEFFGIIEQVSGMEIERMALTWIESPGVPKVFVSFYIHQKVIITQNRLKKNVQEAYSKWMIPLTLHFSDGNGREHRTQLLLDQPGILVDAPEWFNLQNPSHWFKLNEDFKIPYRVYYSGSCMMMHRRAIESQTLSIADRVNIIDDLRAWIRLEARNLEPAKVKLSWFTNEQSGAVWSALAMAVPDVAEAHLQNMMSQENTRRFVYDMFSHVHQDKGFREIEGEHYGELNGRQDALSLLVQYDYRPAIDEALEKFESSDVHLAPFLRRPVYLAVVLHGSNQQFDQLIYRLDRTKSRFECRLLASWLSKFAHASRKQTLTESCNDRIDHNKAYLEMG